MFETEQAQLQNSNSPWKGFNLDTVVPEARQAAFDNDTSSTYHPHRLPACVLVLLDDPRFETPLPEWVTCLIEGRLQILREAALSNWFHAYGNQPAYVRNRAQGVPF